uniref:Uncharacterized protein LOC114337896 n=1 Tax=Diabrotica virgifera virgifera TaxID=50390 RepID=A0A6P7GGR0_DIAVI
MAFCFYMNRTAYYRALGRNVYRSLILNVRNNNDCKMLSLELDTIDDFTTQLMQKKVDKWSCKKPIPNVSYGVKYIDNHSIADFSCLDITRINELFQQAIEKNDTSSVLELINQCISHRLCPTLSNLLYTLSVCSQSGDIATIKKIQLLYKETNVHILETHSNFKHYIAEAIWIKGNVQEALNLFKEVYKDNVLLRRRIRLMLKNLIVDIIENRSEAVLVNLVNFAETLANEYKDYFPLSCIWQICFLSEWYSDQQTALNLLNKYEELRKTVINRIIYVVSVSLHNHKVDVIYRLLEVLLKYEMKTQYSGVLLALLDYQIHQKDLRRCVEIIRWSVQNNIQLLPLQHQKFLTLLVTNDSDNADFRKLKPIRMPKTVTHFKF